MLACGNKVSPASLVTTSEGDYTSTELSGMESQHSQVSLFSGSDAGSSLELFSQPPPQTDSISASSSATSSTSRDFTSSINGDNSSMQTGGRKYYTKYLSLAKETGSVAGNVSVVSKNVDPVASKMDFEAWKDKQQGHLERKQVMKDLAAVINEATIKVNDNISVLRDELKTAVDKAYAEDSSAQREEQTLSVLTQVLHGQEESRQMMQEIRDELAQQTSLLTCLSSKICIDTAKSSALIERVIENTFEHAAVSVASVSTQTFSPPQSSELQCNDMSKAGDQAVPCVSTTQCNEESLYGGTNQPPTECSKEANPTRCTSSTDCIEPQAQEGEHPSMIIDVHEKPSNNQTSQVSLFQRTGSKTGQVTGGDKRYGKRKNEGSSSAAMKVPCMTSGRKTRQRVKPDTVYTASRRSSRATKRPVKYMADYCSSSDDLTTGKELPPLHNGTVLNKSRNRIRRRVSSKQADRNCSQTHVNSIRESPVNALSDALYSESSAELPSGIQAVSPLSTRTDPKEKFHRKNEAAKRRKLVISSLTDPDLLLREIQDCILNGVDTSDPSP